MRARNGHRLETSPRAAQLTPPPRAPASINQYLLKNWTEILLVPLIPSVLSLITILFGTIILNTAQLECVQPLGSVSARSRPPQCAPHAGPGALAPGFLAADVVFAYLILLGYTWLLIGPIPVQSLLNTALAMFFLGMVLFFFYIVGSGLLSASSPCVRATPWFLPRAALALC